MNFRFLKRVSVLLGLVIAFSLTGCYKRTTAPTYQYEESEVTKIREQLGAVTPNKEYVNEEEEEGDE